MDMGVETFDAGAIKARGVSSVHEFCGTELQHTAEGVENTCNHVEKTVSSKFTEKREANRVVICAECHKEMSRQAAQKHTRQACFRQKYGQNKCIYCHKEFADMKIRQRTSQSVLTWSGL